MVLLDCRWSMGLRRGIWPPRRLLGDVRGSGDGGQQWECGVWEVTVVAPRSEENEEVPPVPPEPVRFSSAKLLGSLGKLKETDQVIP